MEKLLTEETGKAILEAINNLELISGPDGMSAYMLAMKHGFRGTPNNWLDRLKLQPLSTVFFSISPVPDESVQLILTNADTGKVFIGNYTNELGTGYVVNIDEVGAYKVSYRYAGSGHITFSSSIVAVEEVGKIYTLEATYASTSPIVYTAIIDLSNSNPLTCVSYADNATGMTKGSDDWDNQIIFNSIKPCVFANGQVIYYLDKNNFNLKEDGSPAILDGTDGDVMIEFPKFAYRIYKEDNKIYISITNHKDIIGNDSRYRYYAFSKESEGDKNFVYIGAYKGNFLNNMLQSNPNVYPGNKKNFYDSKELASKRGDGYRILGFYQLTMLQCLYIIKYGNLNCQAALGNGICGRTGGQIDEENYDMIPTGGTETFGMYYGSTSVGAEENIDQAKLAHVKFAGIEDMWGNIWEWIDGCYTTSDGKIITYFNENDQMIKEMPNSTGVAGGLISNVFGSTQLGFLPSATNGSITTYFCDYGIIAPSSVTRFGGGSDSQGYTGIFYLGISYDAEESAWSSIGVRLMYI